MTTIAAMAAADNIETLNIVVMVLCGIQSFMTNKK
jgi:hypothetical protein